MNKKNYYPRREEKDFTWNYVLGKKGEYTCYILYKGVKVYAFGTKADDVYSDKNKRIDFATMAETARATIRMLACGLSPAANEKMLKADIAAKAVKTILFN